MKVAKFVEGSFIPSFDGASERFHQGTIHLTSLGVEMLVLHCYRGWSDLNQIAEKQFKTIAIPSDLYYRKTNTTSQILKFFQADILEVNDLELALSTGLKLSNSLNIPLVFDAQFVSSCLFGSYTKDKSALDSTQKLEKHLGRCVSGATCFTALDKENLARVTMMPRERIQVIPMGSNVEKIHYHKIDADDATIVFIGNMFFLPNQEGVEYIVNQIAPQLLKKYPKLTFRFVGDVPLEIKEKYQSKNIQFTGRLKNINKAFEKARICVAPITTGGGMRTKTLTYMASGVPIVSSPIGVMGIEENPPLLVAHSPEEFIFQIDSLLQNYDISLNLGKKARQLVETKYSWQVFAKRYLNFYHTVEKNPRKHNEQHISIESDPFWLQETIEKGRFADNQGDPNNIYLLGKGEKIAVPADAPDLIDRIKQFLKDY